MNVFKNVLLKNNSWIWISIVLFAVVYALSLTFVYVDQDDAYTLAYHVSGRDNAIQPQWEN